MKLIILVSPLCEISHKATLIARKIAEELGVEFEEVSVTEERGEKLALLHKVTLLPSYIVDDKLVYQGFLDEDELRNLLGR